MYRYLGLEKDKSYFKATFSKPKMRPANERGKKWFSSPDATWL